MINKYISTWKKYFVFKGRASRSEYWTFILINILIAFILGFIEGLLGVAPETDESIFANIFQLLIIIPTIAVGVRRMHDLNKSGWYILIPIYNLILALTQGDKSKNKYGSKPAV